jgi:hypothetical protein
MADIAFDSTGVLYGVASKSGPNLFSVDTTTALATQIGNTFLTSTSGGGVAVDSDGTIWGAPTQTRFGTYNLGDGTFTSNGTLTKPAGGGAYAALAFDEHGVLYGLNSGPGTPPPTHLAIINTNDLSVTDLGACVTSGDAIAFQISTAPAAPSLKIVAQPANQADLRWPVSPGFQLEYKADLNNITWLTNTTTPTVDNGTNVVTVPVQDASFFRLHKP